MVTSTGSPFLGMIASGILSCGAALGAIQLFREHAVLARRGQKALATVTRWNTRHIKGGSVSCPVFRFEGPNGQQIEAESQIDQRSNADPLLLPIGHQIVVVYDPDNPETLRSEEKFTAGPGYLPWAFAAAIVCGALAVELLLEMVGVV
jgi:hypothetical protein